MNEDSAPATLPSGDSVSIWRKRAQFLYARGFIGDEEYRALGQHFGFVKRPARATVGARLTKVTSIAGCVLIGATAAASIVAKFHPQLQGPLDMGLEMLQLLIGVTP